MPFERRGQKPLLTRLDGGEKRDARIVADIAALQAEGFDSIAVITKTAAESREAYESLQTHGGEALRLITKETLAFEKGAMVIPVYLAKGVEFDAVLVYDASPEAYGRENERKLLYTACTRAMHRLHLYTTGEWSPFVQALPAQFVSRKQHIDGRPAAMSCCPWFTQIFGASRFTLIEHALHR